MKYVSSLSVTPVDFGGLGVRDLIPHFLASASVAHIEVAPGSIPCRGEIDPERQTLHMFPW